MVWVRHLTVMAACNAAELLSAPIAQLVEHPAFNRDVRGSNPRGRTKSTQQESKDFKLLSCCFCYEGDGLVSFQAENSDPAWRPVAQQHQ